jgi:hypothetical protein
MLTSTYRQLGSVLAWVEPDGSWTEAPSAVGPRLVEACHQEAATETSTVELHQAAVVARQVATELLARWQQGRWSAARPTPGLRTMVFRLRSAAVAAARQRDTRSLIRLDRELAFLAGGHTAGEQMLIHQLANSDRRQALDVTLPAASPVAAAREVHLTGLILFGTP